MTERDDITAYDFSYYKMTCFTLCYVQDYTMDHSPLLFRLPRELRDEIYRHALYHAGGLLYTVGKNGVGRLCRKARNASSRKSVLTRLYHRSRRIAKAQTQRHGSDYNQLKHVCRRLRDESSALTPHGNVVFTEGSSTMNAFEQCLILLQQLPRVR
ncbi:metal ion binding protein [Alternaria alternata]|nr:metal ion binding protein [Alternaria alternata]